MSTLFPLPVQFPPGDIERYGPAVVRPGRRPDAMDPFVREAAARMVLPRALRWLRDGGCKRIDVRQVIRDLSLAARCEDGFQAASALERRRHWAGANSGLVEILDDLISGLSDACDMLVAVWVREFGISPLLSAGDSATVRLWRDGRMETVSGEILRVDSRHGRYHVFCGRLGHVRHGPGTHAVIVGYEDVSEH